MPGKEILLLQDMIDSARRIVFFGGAGVSTESGIPDFRSSSGLFRQTFSYPPEEIVSQHFFWQNPEEFYRFYKERMVMPQAQPNAAHLKLAELEAAGRLSAVITQNIDGLHQKAGSHRVLELHGSVLRNHCTKCGKSFTVEQILAAEGVPRCSCGGIIKPDVVLYEEPLDSSVLQASIEELSMADLLIVGGTSLVVYPAAGLLRYYTGDSMVLINRDATSYDQKATLCIREKIGEALSYIVVTPLDK